MVLQEGRTPLLLASRLNRYRMVKRLLRRKARADIVAKVGLYNDAAFPCCQILPPSPRPGCSSSGTVLGSFSELDAISYYTSH
jgi:hypothetical protein